MALGRKTGGRQIGTPNKATSDARRAVAEIVDSNSHRLSEWLNTVADGIRKIDSSTGQASSEYLVGPNPAKAFEMYRSLLEYHVPKLTRVQVAGNEFDVSLGDANSKIFHDLLQSLKAEQQLEASKTYNYSSQHKSDG
jgi:hypothetical protein